MYNVTERQVVLSSSDSISDIEFHVTDNVKDGNDLE